MTASTHSGHLWQSCICNSWYPLFRYMRTTCIDKRVRTGRYSYCPGCCWRCLPAWLVLIGVCCLCCCACFHPTLLWYLCATTAPAAFAASVRRCRCVPLLSSNQHRCIINTDTPLENPLVAVERGRDDDLPELPVQLPLRADDAAVRCPVLPLRDDELPGRPLGESSYGRNMTHKTTPLTGIHNNQCSRIQDEAALFSTQDP